MILARSIEYYSNLFGFPGVDDAMMDQVPISSEGALQFTLFERPNKSFGQIVIDYGRISFSIVQILHKFIFDRKKTMQRRSVVIIW